LIEDEEIEVVEIALRRILEKDSLATITFGSETSSVSSILQEIENRTDIGVVYAEAIRDHTFTALNIKSHSSLFDSIGKNLEENGGFALTFTFPSGRLLPFEDIARIILDRTPEGKTIISNYVLSALRRTAR